MLFMSKILFMVKIYARFIILLDSSHMYVLIFKTCPSMTYICTTIGPTPKSFDYRLFGQFLIFPELPRQFEPNMSNLQVRTYPSDQTRPASAPDISSS
jgi:hypothetical protein